MSDLYTEIYDQSTLVAKAHKGRGCVVCDYPVSDSDAATINAGGGVAVPVHKACLHEVTNALAPKAETIPVAPIRKSTVTTEAYIPFEKKRMTELIKAEMYELLLNKAMGS